MTETNAISKPLARQYAGHPLIESMGQAALLNPHFSLPIQEHAGDGWIEATDLFLGDDERLCNLILAYGQNAWGTTNPHAAGSAFIIAYLSRLTWPVIAQYVLARRVPQVSLNNMVFHQTGSGIDATALSYPSFAALSSDPAAGHQDAEVLPDEAALYLRLKEWLFDANVSLVIDALHQSGRASLIVSRNAAAASCSQAFNRLYALADTTDRVVRDAEVFFADPMSLLFGQLTIEVFEHQGRRGFFSRRRGCCLWWRSDRSNDYCSNCILLSREQQDQRFREMLEGRR